MLGEQLAPRIRCEQLARVEPVHGHRARERRGGLARKIGASRTAVRPERGAVGRRVEREDLLHAAVAVRRDDEDETRRETNDDVVMELALRPMIDELERTDRFEERAEHERTGERIDESLERHGDGNMGLTGAARKR